MAGQGHLYLFHFFDIAVMSWLRQVLSTIQDVFSLSKCIFH